MGKEYYMNIKLIKGLRVAEEAIEDNFNSAVETLKKYYNFDKASQKFTNVPTLY